MLENSIQYVNTPNQVFNMTSQKLLLLVSNLLFTKQLAQDISINSRNREKKASPLKNLETNAD